MKLVYVSLIGIILSEILYGVGTTCMDNPRKGRWVKNIIPLRANNSDYADSVIYLYLSNPSGYEQTVSLRLEASGELYFSKIGAQTTGNPKGSTINGSNLLNCWLATNPKTCDMIPNIPNSSNTEVSVLSGTNKQLAIRVRRSSAGLDYPDDQGVAVTICVSDSSEKKGHIIASGAFQQENANGVAYIGGAFAINSGRPF